MPDLESMVKSHEERLAMQEQRSNAHSDRLNKHEERLNQDKEDIQMLKDSDREKDNRIQAVEYNTERLERVFVKENEETRTTVREQTKKLFDIVEQAMGYQQNKSTQDHELRIAKLNTWSTVILKVLGGLSALISAGTYVFKSFFN